MPSSALRRSLLLWFAVSMMLVGCHSPQSHPRRSVDFAPLLVLHPMWQQVKMLQQETDQFTALRRQPEMVSLKLPELPPNFIAPQNIPLNRIKERQQQLAQEASRRIAHDAAQLQSANDAKYLLAERAARAEARATYKRELSARVGEIRRQRSAEAIILQSRIDHLGYRVVALQTQINTYGDQASQTRDDAILQRDRLNADIVTIDTQRVHMLDTADILAQATLELEGERKQLNQTLDAQLGKLRRQLDREAQDKIALFRQRLAQRRDPLPALGTTPMPPLYAHETPLRFPAHQETIGEIGRAQSRLDSEVRNTPEKLVGRREKLVALIRADTEQSVNQLAHLRGWVLVPPGTAGAADATHEAIVYLRQQWRLPSSESN